MRILAVVLAVALAGCSQTAEPKTVPDPGVAIEGWVLDAARAPVANASVTLAGAGVHESTDAEGYFLLQAPSGADLLVTVAAPGFLAASQGVAAFSGATHVLNFTLDRVPDAAPYRIVESYNGVLQCSVTLVVLEDQGTPHEHQGLRCSTVLNDTRNIWHTAIPSNTTGMVVETVWSPQTEVSRGLVMKIVVGGTGDVLGFIEGPSILRVQLSQAKILHNLQAGHTAFTVTIEAGAGTGDHEHGAVGVFYEQAFTVYATTFYNGPVDPAYSIADTL